MASSTDRFEKEILLAAPRARVWRAITDVNHWNAWFGVTMTSSFIRGHEVAGHFPDPRYAHVLMKMWIETIEPERTFAFRWHPYAITQGVDYSAEPTTLVTFTLEEEEGGVRLRVAESGFDRIPEARRAEAFRMNESGWEAQLENIRKFLARPVKERAGAGG